MVERECIVNEAERTAYETASQVLTHGHLVRTKVYRDVGTCQYPQHTQSHKSVIVIFLINRCPLPNSNSDYKESAMPISAVKPCLFEGFALAREAQQVPHRPASDG